MKFDIIFSIMAIREIEFFLKALSILKERGYPNVDFITFHEAEDKILEKECIPYFSMQKMAEIVDIKEKGVALSDKIESNYGIASIRSLFTHDRFTSNKKKRVNY